VKVLNWLAKQANLAECSRSMGGGRSGGHGGGNGGGEFKKSDAHKHIVDSFGASVVEPWLAAHADPSRLLLFHDDCVLFIWLLLCGVNGCLINDL